MFLRRIAKSKSNLFVNKCTSSDTNPDTSIAVGGGPSGPLIEGPFCRAVHLCRALGDRKIEKKSKKKQKTTKKEGKIEKRRERNE